MLLLLGACNLQELSQSWEIDRLRVLAVAAEPAEPAPGQVVTFSSLVVSPVDPVAAVAWTACVGDSDDEYGCGGTSTASGFDGAITDDLDPEAFAEAGGIGIEPYFPPSWTVPADVLDDLDEAAQAEGKTATITVAAIPDKEDLGAEDMEIALKRLPVSRARTPNHNPAIAGLLVDGIEVPEGGLVTLGRGQAYSLEVVLAEAGIETYSFTNSEGVEETRTEEPWFSWYLSEGSFDQALTLWPYTTVEYRAPDEPAAAAHGLWVVVRDRRGGMAWRSARVAFY